MIYNLVDHTDPDAPLHLSVLVRNIAGYPMHAGDLVHWPDPGYIELKDPDDKRWFELFEGNLEKDLDHQQYGLVQIRKATFRA